VCFTAREAENNIFFTVTCVEKLNENRWVDNNVAMHQKLINKVYFVF
jgi:hypothetical protein